MVRKALLLAVCGVVWMPLSAVAAVCDDGVREYQDGHYDKAVQLLNRATGADPRNAMVHYYLANSLVHLKQHEDAIVEYRMCLALDPAGAVSDYCKQALKSYHRKLPTPAEAQEMRDTAYGTAPAAAPRSYGESKMASHAASANQTADRSLTLIRKQVLLEKKKNEQLAETTASDALTVAQTQIERIRQDAENRIQKLYATPRLMRQQTPFGQAELDAAAQKIREQAKEEEEFVLRQAHQKADRYRQIGELRRSALDQVADDLEQQLTDDGKYSGVKMVPEGTNLYVRSYVSTPTVRPVPDAHGAVARIYAQHGADHATDADSASADKLPLSTGAATRSVHGKILKQPN